MGERRAAFFARSKARLMMKYRDVEYTVVQGIERGLWKWCASVAGVVITGPRGHQIRGGGRGPSARLTGRSHQKRCGSSRPRIEVCAVYGTTRRSKNLNRCFRSPPWG